MQRLFVPVCLNQINQSMFYFMSIHSKMIWDNKNKQKKKKKKKRNLYITKLHLFRHSLLVWSNMSVIFFYVGNS